MEVKGINTNAYNANLSEYAQTTQEGTASKVQAVETKSLEVNNDNKEYSKKELDNALKKINNFLKDEHTRAEYSVHKDLDVIMIKIVDEDTDKVILEIPSEKILNMVAFMCKEVGLIDKKA